MEVHGCKLLAHEIAVKLTSDSTFANTLKNHLQLTSKASVSWCRSGVNPERETKFSEEVLWLPWYQLLG